MNDFEIYDSAAALYDGGWKAEDKDQMMSEYDMTEDEAEAICELLKNFEEKKED